MQTTKNTHNTLKKLFGIITAGAFAIAPLASVVTPAEAAPFVLAADNDRNRDVRTIEGVVVNDTAGREFNMRQSNGQRITVRVQGGKPRRLSTGDRVRVTGFFRRNDNNIFRADSVRILDNQNNSNSNVHTVEGIVVNDSAGREFNLRRTNGQRIRVVVNGREPKRLSVGDRVRVTGSFRRNDADVFRADTVQILDNQNSNTSRTFNGRVTDVESDQRFNMVSDGKTYNVTASSRLPRRLEEGDTVRVYGRRSGDNDIVNATVVVTRNTGNNNNNNNNNNNRDTFIGRVTDVQSNQRFDILVNGTTYNVTTSSRLPRDLDKGDNVRVVGRRTGDNDIVNATVTGIQGNNTEGTFIGRVTEIRSSQRFDVLVNGKTYNVTTTSRLPRDLNKGDNVRIYGRRTGDNDIVEARVTGVADGNSNGNSSSLRTFIGRVTDVESDKRFDMVSGGQTYNVTVSSRLSRRLKRGDMVRVFGARSGDNNITNATVSITNNR